MADVELLPCAECGMPCRAGEYHPFAACLMFKACHNSETVRANLAPLQAENERLRAEVDALARENEAMKRCATKYLEWLGVTHMPLDQALRDDMHNPRMCGDAALVQQPAAPSDEHLIETGCYQTVIDRHSQPATSAEPPYEIDALFDALSNLEHDNYERSYSGSKNREADAGLIRAALERYAATLAHQQGGHIDG